MKRLLLGLALACLALNAWGLEHGSVESVKIAASINATTTNKDER